MQTRVISDYCPYCGESIELVIDCSIDQQSYIEDCFVCCRPITVSVYCADGDTEPRVRLMHENEVG